MALQTPRRFQPSSSVSRPSFGHSAINTASSPSLGVSISTAMARKASLNALTGGGAGSPRASGGDAGDGAGDIEVGDLVDVPGGMHGTVKFVGSVSGRKGVFAGVELSKEYATKGKNDGDVDGTRYFATSVPGSGIFLPLHRAAKRASPTLTSDTFPPTPTTPSFGNVSVANSERPHDSNSPPTPSVLKFSQSVGPGARAPSPQFKPTGRPSLPRPESPSRRQPNLSATPVRGTSGGPSSLSKSVIGAPRYGTASPSTAKIGGFKARTPGPRAQSRNNSRLGHQDAIDEDGDTTPVGRPYVRPASRASHDDARQLRQKLEEREKQLKEQAASLAEMESSLAELQTLLPEASAASSRGSRGSGLEDADAAKLRGLLREKNEKIQLLTAEFDAHRADFRSTIDTLEMASTETERVYERRVEELTAEVRELKSRDDDVESVAIQLKQLEELVQELEEGLEDARRGEAEARGEVEFLRGEVERGRSELRREREKAAAALRNAGASVDGSAAAAGNGSTPSTHAGAREVEQRDDEIRGLKAIIHSLSSGGPDRASPQSAKFRNSGSGGGPNGADADEFRRLRDSVRSLERQRGELQGLVDRKSFREEELERELERLRRDSGGALSNGGAAAPGGSSERTPTQLSMRDSLRDSKGSRRASPRAHHNFSSRTYHPPPADAHHHHHHPPPRATSGTGLAAMMEADTTSSSDADGPDALWCEICESHGHDILHCTNVLGGSGAGGGGSGSSGAPPPRASQPSRLRTSGPTSPPPTTAAPALSPAAARRTLSADRPSPLTPSKKLPSPSTPKASAAAQQQQQALPPPAYNPYDSAAVAGKGEGAPDLEKWCALCERDGHDATNCPFEDAF